jgi:hypothetical protein
MWHQATCRIASADVSWRAQTALTNGDGLVVQWLGRAAGLAPAAEQVQRAARAKPSGPWKGCRHGTWDASAHYSLVKLILAALQ